MSGTSKLGRIGTIASSGVLLSLIAFVPSAREKLVEKLGLSSAAGLWRAAAILLALANLKNLPFVWHIRLFRALLYHLYLQPTPLPKSALFKPIITTTRSPLLECDYNLHKSNSTYFSDVDISRTHLVTALLRSGIRRSAERQREWDARPTAPGAEPVPPGKFYVALGGVACVFRREIRPYEKFEIWTRLLCWDRKWAYFVSHLVKAGVNKPAHHALQPWHKARPVKKETAEEKERRKERVLKSVFATSIAKYVVKKGRLTIPPEDVLRDAGMLPEKKEGHVNGNGYAKSEVASNVGVWNDDAETAALGDTFEEVEGGEWTWERVEAQRQRGLKFAESFGGLDGLHQVFDGGENGAMGQFADMIFWR